MRSERPGQIVPDSYVLTRNDEDLGSIGGGGTFALWQDPGDEVIEIALILTETADAERVQNQVLEGLNRIGDDATALSEAQAALEIPAPIDPGDIDHNDLASRSTADAHPASAITNTPAGNISATTVQGALNELDTDKEIAGAAATAISNHESDVTAHPASSITNTPAGGIAATTVQAALNELDSDKEAAGTAATAISNHESDTTAHPASSITNTPAGNIAATTVQGALNELDSDKAAASHTHTLSAITDAGDSAGLDVGTGSGTVAAGDDARFIALTKWLDLYLWRFFPRGCGTQGWTSATSGSGTNFYINSPQYASENRANSVIAFPMVSTGTTGSGTNARVVYPGTYAQRYLYDNYRFVFRTMAVQASSISIVRFGLWGNGLTPAATGRPTYGIWLEKDAATNGNSNWWLCAANGGAVSSDDTGIAFNATQRVWMLEFESTSSCKAWELVTSTSSEQASVTTGLPSGTTQQTCTEFWQVLSANTSPEGKFGPPNGDMGALRYDTGLEYLIPS